MNEAKCVVTFKSIHHVIKGESLLKGKEIWSDMIPNPRTISTDCGMALVFLHRDLMEAEKALEEGAVESAHFFLVCDGAYEEIKRGDHNE